MPRIQKIHKLNIASFRNFPWNSAVSEFSDNVNIFLGWNGSWKTAISRLFLSFEKNELCTQISSWTFEVFIDGAKHTQTSISWFQDNIRVFNEDYIKQILGEGMLPHIIYIWDTAVDYSKQEKLLLELEDEIKKINLVDTFTEIARSEASNIKTIPWIALIGKDLQSWLYNSYDSSSFVQRVKDISEKLDADNSKKIEDFYLTDETITEHKKKLANQELKKKQSWVIKKWDEWIIAQLETINNLLAFSPVASTSKRIEQFLKEEKDWIEKGVSLHKLADEEHKKDTCLFCWWTISNSEELLRHFTKDILELTTKIWNFSTTIQSALVELNSMDEFYQTEKNSLITAINEIQKELKKKDEDKTYLSPTTIVFSSVLGENGVEGEALDSVASQLETHYVAKKYADYTSKKATYEGLKAKKEGLLTQKKTTEQELNILKAKEHDLHIAPERLNKLLEITFPYKKIELTNSTDGVGYVLTRSWDNCKLSDLSEWERNFIALVYFLISINSNWWTNTLSEDWVVLIDDPISSLDSNSIFQVFSLIATEIESKPSRQYFLLTHNLDFFGHLYNHFRIKKEWREEQDGKSNQFYEVRFWGDGSSIANLNRLLANYRTDYQYGISKLMELENSTEMEDAFLIVNLLRRVLETFLQFKFWEWDYKTKLEKMYMVARDKHLLSMDWAPEHKKEELRQDYLARSKAMYNFTNYGSHKFSGMDTIDDTLLLSSSKMIKDFFKIVKTVDKEHYDYIIWLNT